MKNIQELLARYLDDEDAVALDAACASLRNSNLDMSALLEWMARYPADKDLKALAERRVRAALGLSVVGGAVCRR